MVVIVGRLVRNQWEDGEQLSNHDQMGDAITFLYTKKPSPEVDSARTPLHVSSRTGPHGTRRRAWAVIPWPCATAQSTADERATSFLFWS